MYVSVISVIFSPYIMYVSVISEIFSLYIMYVSASIVILFLNVYYQTRVIYFKDTNEPQTENITTMK